MLQTLSFTKQIKEEIISNDYESSDRLKALLSAFVRITGRISFQNKETKILLSTENAKTAKFIYTTINRFYKSQTHIDYKQRTTFKKNTIYEIVIEENADQVLDDLNIDFLDSKITHWTIKNDDMISGYLAGAFLGSGSINSPHTSNYHLEISLNDEKYARWFLHLFSRYKNTNLVPKIIERRGKYVIYLKKSDQIAEFLVMIGAVNCCMEFENVRIDRDFSNSTNRLLNFDAANMKKTVMAAQKQVREIEYLSQVYGLENIHNKKAQLLCELRLKNESASLTELASLMSEELGVTITRSNVAHLFTYIDKLYGKVMINEN